MAEDVLEGADVGVGIEEMCRETVSKGVAGDALGDGGFFEGFLELPLHGVFEEVIPGEFPGAGMGAKFSGREEEAPGELKGGIGIFALEGEREVDGGAVVLELVLVLLLELFELDLEVGLQGLRERDDAVFAAFGVVDLDGVVVEVEVFDPQCHGFTDAQSGAIHELGAEEPGSFELAEEFVDFGATEDSGRAFVFPGCQGSLDDELPVLEDGAVEEDKGVEGLFLGRGGDGPVENEVVEEGGDGIWAEVFRGFTILFQGETKVVGDPLAVCFFGGDGLSGEAKGLTGAIEDVVQAGGGGPGLACWRGFGIDGDAFAEEVAVCFGRVFCFEAEGFPVEGAGPGQVEEITGEDSRGLDGLIELPVGKVGGSRKGGKVCVGVFGSAVGFCLHEGLGPVLEIRVGLRGQSQVNESCPELFSQWLLIFIIVHENTNEILSGRRCQGGNTVAQGADAPRDGGTRPQ